jgi:hypothetical protein
MRYFVLAASNLQLDLTLPERPWEFFGIYPAVTAPGFNVSVLRRNCRHVVERSFG